MIAIPFGPCAIFLLPVGCFGRLSPNLGASEADEIRQARPIGSTESMSATGMLAAAVEGLNVSWDSGCRINRPSRSPVGPAEECIAQLPKACAYRKFTPDPRKDTLALRMPISRRMLLNLIVTHCNIFARSGRLVPFTALGDSRVRYASSILIAPSSPRRVQPKKNTCHSSAQVGTLSRMRS